MTGFEMTWIKICGMTNLEDALTAVEAGADAVGFVFYGKSPRRITVEAAREIVEKLPERVEKVGVFAGESLVKAVEIGTCVGFDSLQVYPLSSLKNVPSAVSRDLPKQKRLYFAFPMEKLMSDNYAITFDVMRSPENTFVGILLDSGGTRRPGGTGMTFEWNEAAPIVARLSRTQNVVIAGGLTAQNVGEAIGILQPWGVDVASGVEAGPGKKDPEKVRAFVKAVREAERAGG
jgi:phosphoribosylanthranilate isomerase